MNDQEYEDIINAMIEDDDNFPDTDAYNEEAIDEMKLRKKPGRSRKQIAAEEGI